MTPDLAGFIAEGDDPQTWDEITPAVLAALTAEFNVLPERAVAAAQRTTWLDTFDWRLHKAGLTLEHVPARGGSELRLSGADPGQAATQLVTGWQASRPHLLAALAGGPVGTRIAGLAAPRALIPLVATSTVTSVYRLLNEDNKTVARLLVDRPSVVGPRPGEPAAALPPRLTIAEVRGYPGQARRATRLIAAVPGVQPAGTRLVDRRAARRRPPSWRLLQQGRRRHHPGHARRHGGRGHPVAPARHDRGERGRHPQGH